MKTGASDDPEVAALLEAIRSGQADASALYRQLYDELHGLAPVPACAMAGKLDHEHDGLGPRGLRQAGWQEGL